MDGEAGDIGLKAGQRAERLVHSRLQAALPGEYRLYPNVRWLTRTADHRGLRDGEADLVIAHPDRGILVLEVKAGEIRRDAEGRWWAKRRRLNPDPFSQASISLHALLRKLRELPEAPGDFRPVAGHAVALPDIDLASVAGRVGLLGLHVDHRLILDQPRLVEGAEADLQSWVQDALDQWAGEGGRSRTPGATAVELLDLILTEPIELRSRLRHEVDQGEREVLRLTHEQRYTLSQLRHQRRVAIAGGAGTGKTLLAAEKARRLAREGYRTLLVCFNSALAGWLAADTAEIAAKTGLLRVSTFHQLCEELAAEAAILPPRPEPIPQDWWDGTLPDGLDRAIERLGPQFHAVVVDEGQDFAAGWLTSLELLLHDGPEGVLYVFHDPAQAIFRPDAVAELGLSRFDLVQNCRNARPIHDLVARFADGGLAGDPLRNEAGRPPELIAAETSDDALAALRATIHDLRTNEGLRPWEIAVLTGVPLDHSAAWTRRRFGNEVLWNGAVGDDGRSLGLAAAEVPEPPGDAILIESIRRFKGLERPAIVLVELQPDDPRLDRLLYVGLSRARQHLVAIAPAAVLARLERSDPT